MPCRLTSWDRNCGRQGRRGREGGGVGWGGAGGVVSAVARSAEHLLQKLHWHTRQRPVGYSAKPLRLAPPPRTLERSPEQDQRRACIVAAAVPHLRAELPRRHPVVPKLPGEGHVHALVLLQHLQNSARSRRSVGSERGVAAQVRDRPAGQHAGCSSSTAASGPAAGVPQCTHWNPPPALPLLGPPRWLVLRRAQAGAAASPSSPLPPHCAALPRDAASGTFWCWLRIISSSASSKGGRHSAGPASTRRCRSSLKDCRSAAGRQWQAAGRVDAAQPQGRRGPACWTHLTPRCSDQPTTQVRRPACSLAALGCQPAAAAAAAHGCCCRRAAAPEAPPAGPRPPGRTLHVHLQPHALGGGVLLDDRGDGLHIFALAGLLAAVIVQELRKVPLQLQPLLRLLVHDGSRPPGLAPRWVKPDRQSLAPRQAAGWQGRHFGGCLGNGPFEQGRPAGPAELAAMAPSSTGTGRRSLIETHI